VNSGPSAAAVAVALVGFATGASAVTGGARSVGPVTEAVAESAMVAAAASPPFTAAGAASSSLGAVLVALSFSFSARGRLAEGSSSDDNGDAGRTTAPLTLRVTGAAVAI
jgi:hypothetical protein